MLVESQGWGVRALWCQLFIKHGERAQVAIGANGVAENFAGLRESVYAFAAAFLACSAS
jgi:hypothetical protein